MNSLLEISNLTCGYDSIKILNDINLNVKEGQIVSLLGVNGAGKTTLINSIFGLSKIFNGEIRFNNEIINGCATHEVVQKGIGCIPEGRKVFPNMTVGDNLRVGSYLVKEKKEVKERFKKVFKLFPKLKERVSQIASGMSGGEQAMLSIGRGLMLKPTILIIDEPSLGLSPKLIQDTFTIIKEINNSGVTILLVEQNVEQTIKISDYCYLLSNNKIIVQGSGEDLSKNSEMQKAYFGEKK